MGLVSGLSLANHSDCPSWWCMLVQPRWVPEKRTVGGGQTRGVSFWPFMNSSGWWRFISSVFLTRTSCRKTTHTNGYYGAWPGWVVSVSVLHLTKLSGVGLPWWSTLLMQGVWNQSLVGELSSHTPLCVAKSKTKQKAIFWGKEIQIVPKNKTKAWICRMLWQPFT